jgi:hypothetical protein
VIALRSPRRRQLDVTRLAGEETSRAPASS